MKNGKKIASVVLATAVAATAGLALTACGDTQAKMTGNYMSENTNVFSNFNLDMGYNYYTLTFSGQQIQTYDDGTYCLTVNSETYSAIDVGKDIPSKANVGNDQGHTITEYYGAYTATTDSEGDITLKLDKPTRIVDSSSKRAQMLDTAAWTDDMAKAVVTQGMAPEQVMDKDGNPLTGATYIDYAITSWGDVEVLINGTSGTFAYIAIK